MKQYFLKYNEFLNESLKTARTNFLEKGLIDKDSFNLLYSIDPSSTNKYLDKLCDWFIETPEYFFKNRNIDMKKLVKAYHDMINKGILNKPELIKFKDINSFDTVLDFVDFVNKFEYSISKTEAKKSITKKVKIILDNERFFIVSPKTWEESKIFGAGTRWCTASKDSITHWNIYTKDKEYTIYYILDRTLPVTNKNYKMAVTVTPSGEKEIWDSTDNMDTVTGELYTLNFNKYIEETGLPENLFVSDNPREYIPIPEETKKELIKWIPRYDDDDFKMRTDGTIDFVKNKNLSIDFAFKETLPDGQKEMPFQLNKVNGDFFMRTLDYKLETLKGFPKKVVDSITLSKCWELESLEGIEDYQDLDINIDKCGITLWYLPKKMKRLEVTDCEFVDLSRLEEIDQLIINDCATVVFPKDRKIKVNQMLEFYYETHNYPLKTLKNFDNFEFGKDMAYIRMTNTYLETTKGLETIDNLDTLNIFVHPNITLSKKGFDSTHLPKSIGEFYLNREKIDISQYKI